MARCQGTPVFTPAPPREAQRDLASATVKKRGDGLERRPPAGIARERETSADGTPNCITPVEQKGGDRLERRSPTGIARERETSADGAPNCITPVEQKGGDGLERRSPTGIARERETSADDAPNCVTPVEQKGGDGLERRSPTGIARERETSADSTELCQRECRTLQPPWRDGCRVVAPRLGPRGPAPAQSGSNRPSTAVQPPSAKSTEPVM